MIIGAAHDLECAAASCLQTIDMKDQKLQLQRMPSNKAMYQLVADIVAAVRSMCTCMVGL